VNQALRSIISIIQKHDLTIEQLASH